MKSPTDATVGTIKVLGGGMSDLADRLEAAKPDELAALGWEAARVLLGMSTASISCLDQELRGNPDTSLDACKRLHEAALPGWGVRIELAPAFYKRRFGNGSVKVEVMPPITQVSTRSARSHGKTISTAWLAAMLRVKA
jgi:hypothetical protein